jgi:hypothetical protein
MPRRSTRGLHQNRIARTRMVTITSTTRYDPLGAGCARSV